MSPEELGYALREDWTPFLKNRSWVIGLGLYNIHAMSAIPLYQVGILTYVPEVQLPGEDVDKINGSV